MNVMNLFFHGKRNKKNVALTFDDSPAEETLALLKALKRENVSATFFVLGNRIKGRGEIMRKIINQGHQLGNHSYSHQSLWFKFPQTIFREITRCDYELKKLDISTNLFRPPYFRFGLTCWIICLKLRKRVVFCDVVSQDWKRKGVAWTVNRVLENVKPGSIINLHDYLENVGRNKEIVEITTRIIKVLKERGYRFLTVSELLV